MSRMFTIKKIFQEKNIHFAFEVSLIGKCILASLEILGGIATYFVTKNFIVQFITSLTREEFVEDKNDIIANYLLHAAQNFSISTQHFTALYLLSHGVIKMILIIGLFRKKLSYYPASIVVFSGFILYQFYRFASTQSPWLLLITLLDIVVLWMTWHEYKYLKSRKAMIE